MTGRDWQIGRILGIPIKVHPSWFVVFAFLTWSLATGYFPAELPGQSALRYWGMGGVAAVLLFASVLLHELGHSYVALRYRVPIAQITLFFFGGMAQMRAEPPGPRAEFLIAIAGPIVSLVLAAGLFGLLFLGDGIEPLRGLFVLGVMLGNINLTLGVFNLIPGFPLDGGRVLRAGLWAWSGDFYGATRQASLVGQAFGLALGLLGAGLILSSLIHVLPSWAAANGGWMLLIGMFLFAIAKGSRRQASIRSSLSRVTVAEVMAQPVVTLAPELNVDEAATRYFLPYGYRGFPVVEDGHFIGMLVPADLQDVPQALWVWKSVRDLMHPSSRDMEITSDATALRALEHMMQGGHDRLVVVDQGRIVGLITRSGVGRVLQLGGAARTSPPAHGKK